jgi:hypothetical protein
MMGADPRFSVNRELSNHLKQTIGFRVGYSAEDFVF